MYSFILKQCSGFLVGYNVLFLHVLIKNLNQINDHSKILQGRKMYLIAKSTKFCEVCKGREKSTYKNDSSNFFQKHTNIFFLHNIENCEINLMFSFLNDLKYLFMTQAVFTFEKRTQVNFLSFISA